MLQISHCFNTKLLEICKQARLLEELQSKLAQYLPKQFLSHLRIGNFDKGCLVLITDDSVWASQIRYYIPELRDKLRSEGGLYQLVSIKLTIACTLAEKQTERKKQNRISHKTRQLLMQSAQEYSYEPLRKALEHLASYASAGTKPDCNTG